MSNKLQTIIEISAGDISGIDALTELENVTQETAVALDNIKQSGGFGGLAVSARDIESATIKMEALASQSRLLRQEIVGTVAGFKGLEQGTPDFDKQTQKLAKQIEQYRKLNDEIEDIPKNLAKANDFESRIGQTREQVGRFGDAESSANQLLGVAGRLGGTDIEAIGLVATELVATAESMPILLESVKGIGELALTSSGKFATLATSFAPAIAGATGLSLSLSAVVAVALPFVALLGAGAGAIAVFNENNKASVESTRAVIEVQKELFNLIENGTQQQVRDEIYALEDRERALRGVVTQGQAVFAEFERSQGKARTQIADIFNFGGAQEYRKDLEANEAELRKVQTALALHNQALNTAQIRANTFAQGVSDLGKAYAEGLRDPKSALDALETATQKQKDVEIQLSALRDELADATGENAVAIQRSIDKLTEGGLAEANREITALTSAIQMLGFESADQAEAELRRTGSRIEAQRTLDQLFISGDQEQARQRRDANQREIDYLSGIMPLWTELAITSGEAGVQLEAYQDRLSDLQAEQRVLTDDTISLIAVRRQEDDVIKSQLESFNQRLQAEIEFSEVMATGSVDSIQSRIDAIERERSAIRGLLPELQALASTSPEAQAELTNLQNRLAGLGDEARKLSGEALPNAIGKLQQEGLVELQKAEAETAKSILEIRTKALDDLEKIEAKRAEAIGDITKTLDKAIAESYTQVNKEIGKTNAEFMADSREGWDEFYRDQKEAQVDYLKDLERINEEWQLTSLEAEENNNIVAFIQAKRRRDQELKDASETARDEADVRREEFQREEAERQKELQSRIAQIQTEGQETRDKAREQFDERLATIEEQSTKELVEFRKGVDERMKAEQTALTERVNTIRQQYRLEESLIQSASSKRNEALAGQEQAIIDQQEKVTEAVLDGVEETGNAQLDKAKQIEQAKLDFQSQAMRQFAEISNQAFSSIFNNIQRGAQITLSALQRSVNSGSSSSSSSSYSAERARVTGQRTITQFGNGGVIPRDTRFIEVNDVGGNEREAIVKFQPSKGIQPSDLGLDGGFGGDNFDFSGATFGDNLTRDDLMEFARAIRDGVSGGLKGAKQS